MNWIRLTAFAFGLGLWIPLLLAARAIWPQGSPEPPSIVLMNQSCDEDAVLTAVFPPNSDAATVHRYWIDAFGETRYDIVQVRILPGGSLEARWKWDTKEGTPWWGRLDWKGGPEEGISTGHTQTCTPP